VSNPKPSVYTKYEQACARIRELEADKERLEWLANTVLCCDYGDNDRLSTKQPGWRVMEFIAPVMYGGTYREAIDDAMQTEASRKRIRSAAQRRDDHG
jgi:hypothetical protein